METRKNVQDYYRSLQTNKDLKSNACKCSARPADSVQKALSLCSPEVLEKYYGCGFVFPPDELLKGLSVLDLGSGAGRDCFLMSQFVGEDGSVLGIDMTDELVEFASSQIPYHMEKFGYSKPNVSFHVGLIEELAEVQDNSIDLIISNCVVNLCPRKDEVLNQAFRVLKEGGEIYFSDVYSDRRIPEHLAKDQVLWGECLSGAFYWKDFLDTARACGFLDSRVMSCTPITVANKELESKLALIKFYSITFRLFKISDLENDCEDYGQAVRYKGTVPRMTDRFILDNHHEFDTGKVYPVCGNTFSMLQNTRFSPHFDFFGDRHTHFGTFPGCGRQPPFSSSNSSVLTSGKCC